MNFGKWIVVAFVLFALFIGSLVTVCVRQDIALVTDEYYKEELVYQEQIDRMENANKLAVKPEILVAENSITLNYENLPSVEKGQLKLLRPSDKKLDEQFTLKRSSGTSQVFTITNPVRGMYRASFTWEQYGKEYFIEKIVVL
jgi:hypothetical protein